jgi:hypothetical protein
METSKFGVIANEIGVRTAGFQSDAKSGDASLDSAIRMNLKTIAPVPAIVRRSDMALALSGLMFRFIVQERHKQIERVL